jgi:hypothetical protein
VEISEQTLRALTAAADDEHRAGMAQLPDQIAELHRGQGRALRGHSRRQFLTRLAASTAAITIGTTVLPLRRLVGPTLAQEGDAGLAAYAQSVELAAVQAYMAAAKSGKVTTKAVLDAATAFAGHHQEHAAAFGAAAGSSATNKPNPKLLQGVGGEIGGAADEAAIVKIAYDVENAAAATYLFALGALTTPEALQLTASILPIEAQHAVVLGTVLGMPVDANLVPPFQTVNDALKPADYPI